jgi:hypothetical protein
MGHVAWMGEMRKHTGFRLENLLQIGQLEFWPKENKNNCVCVYIKSMSSRMRWLGHVTHTEFWFETLRETTWETRHIWEDNIKMDPKEIVCNFLSMIMSLWNFWTNWAAVTFSRRGLAYGVSVSGMFGCCRNLRNSLYSVWYSLLPAKHCNRVSLFEYLNIMDGCYETW